MSLIEWDQKKLSVLVPEMDEQHKKWIALINNLHDSLLEEDKEFSAEKALTEMRDYTRYHFSKEEQLMRDAGYPDYEAHLKAHVYFIAELMELEHELDSGRMILRTEIMSILKNWLEEHIFQADRRYGEFLAKKQP